VGSIWKENWKRGAKKRSVSAIDDHDLVRVEDLAGITGVSGGGSQDLTASGFVVGPGSATDNAIALYDGITGELVKDSLVTVDVTGAISTPAGITIGGSLVNSVASGLTTTFNITDDFFNGATSGVSTVNLPASPTIGQTHIIKDLDGTASGSSITISGNGNTVDGDASVDLVNNFESITVIFGPTEWNVV